MAENDRGKYHTNAGWIPALVTAQYDDAGDVVANGAATEDADVASVDVVLVAWDNSKRTSVTRGTGVNEFEFTDTLNTT